MSKNYDPTAVVPDPSPQPVIELLQSLLTELDKARINNQPENYCSYLHGQITGIALALRISFPGPGNWGEKAALLLRPYVTEHKCDCRD